MRTSSTSGVLLCKRRASSLKSRKFFTNDCHFLAFLARQRLSSSPPRLSPANLGNGRRGSFRSRPKAKNQFYIALAEDPHGGPSRIIWDPNSPSSASDWI